MLNFPEGKRVIPSAESDPFRCSSRLFTKKLIDRLVKGIALLRAIAEAIHLRVLAGEEGEVGKEGVRSSLHREQVLLQLGEASIHAMKREYIVIKLYSQGDVQRTLVQQKNAVGLSKQTREASALLTERGSGDEPHLKGQRTHG